MDYLVPKAKIMNHLQGGSSRNTVVGISVSIGSDPCAETWILTMIDDAEEAANLPSPRSGSRAMRGALQVAYLARYSDACIQPASTS